MSRCLASAAALAAVLSAAVFARSEEKSAPAQPPPAALFDRLDANHDGELTKDEIPQDKQPLFDRLLRAAHKDTGASLTRDEFVAGLKEGRPERPLDRKRAGGFGGPPQADPDQMLKRLDANGDGKITLDEVPEARRPMFQRLLAQADKNGDGALTREELAGGLRAMRERFQSAARRPEHRARHLDLVKNGKISREEFIARANKRFDKIDANHDGFIDREEVKRRAEHMSRKPNRIEHTGRVQILHDNPDAARTGNLPAAAGTPDEPPAD